MSEKKEESFIKIIENNNDSKENITELKKVNINKEKCQICNFEIIDKFCCMIDNLYYHNNCLSCSKCQKNLSDSLTCFFIHGQIYCKDDYIIFFTKKCKRCQINLNASDYVQRINSDHYHPQCLTCIYCQRIMEKGEIIHLLEGEVVCSMDYTTIMGCPLTTKYMKPQIQTAGISLGYGIPSNNIDIDLYIPHHSLPFYCNEMIDSNGKGSKRPRTILNNQQRKAFKIAFEKSAKPCRKVREQLAKETGLSVRVVQVWFQNQRAKIKKIKKKHDGGSSDNLIDTEMGNDSTGKIDERNSSSPSYKSDDNDSDDDLIDDNKGKSVESNHDYPIAKLYSMHNTYFDF
ncbi:Homeobox domain and Zinc finger, LIM-type domain and Homeodomain-like-containing protein [Strongyloides ratti]|uniref:Homeobox domain and Zinc finger, LIM-type domain and Homeodomain-like-containing protein n=1 Tax=Strongyloides ratti TaxID=34506 RepID=A0A090KV51_STRRB|nr:Homeobox domain and Zinc finger, LIM-type domain and Homeodomain-like-containing protein [Strongyloides ratti]CEF61286.1 Homeobox domain and Zinc finger, LIM-type domain and Homeodomain-like-containing protein [Strongyloides ratti]